ncbi:hypothetical protein MHBO_002813 [Bonamia ostreae]|uniref:Uncharacterized protein n=1 Tax=Bonamia ostreae TaxID=126728 RepID=A0ABV2ANM1_9EUKA
MKNGENNKNGQKKPGQTQQNPILVDSDDYSVSPKKSFRENSEKIIVIEDPKNKFFNSQRNNKNIFTNKMNKNSLKSKNNLNKNAKFKVKKTETNTKGVNNKEVKINVKFAEIEFKTNLFSRKKENFKSVAKNLLRKKD